MNTTQIKDTRNYPQLRYDIRKAYRRGVKCSIISDAQRIGLSVTNYELMPVLMCAIIEVKSIKKLPAYIEELPNCWEFEYKYPL